MKLDFKLRGIDPKEFSDTAAAMYRMRAACMTIARRNGWNSSRGYPKTGLNYRFFEIQLNEPVRSYVGPQRNIPGSVSMDKVLAQPRSGMASTAFRLIALLFRRVPIFLRKGTLPPVRLYS